MPDTLTKNERAVLKSALQTGGRLRFETWTHRGTRVDIVNIPGAHATFTGITQGAFDLAITLEARGYIEFVSHIRGDGGEVKFYKLTEAGTARAKRVR